MASRKFAYGFAVFGFAAGILGLLLLVYKDYDEQSEQLSKSGSRANLKRQEQIIGHWTEWTNQPCSFSDSGCFVIVLATCNTTSTIDDCPGFGYYLINCTAENCPAIWTEWTTGKDNNDVCIHKRERNCTGIPSAPSCASRDTETVFCNTSEWSMWSNWTCHLDQYDHCVQYRSRECYVGLDRKQCRGEKSETLPCTTEHCKGFLQPVWSEWTTPICFNDSGGCYIVRNRTCSAGSDSHCIGRNIDIKPCGVNDCKATWLAWSHWECSRSHGQYIANRIRHCSTGRADDCEGYPYDSMPCGIVECPECQIVTTPKPVQGSWLEWSHWECLDNTTSIVARRVRNCSTGDDHDCDGRPYLLAICSATECPECYKDMTSSVSTEMTSVATTITTSPTARWLEWSSWQCGFKDNNYFHARYRECSTGNASDCVPNGDYKEFSLCINEQCPECLNFSTASTEPTTTATVEPCEDAHEIHCDETNFQDIVCKDIELAEKYCRKTCKRCVPAWYPWTSWECATALGLTFQIRHRKCNSTGCEGDRNELIYCNQSICPDCFKGLSSAPIPPLPSASGTVLSTESTVHQGSSTTVTDTCRDVTVQCKDATFQSIVCKDTNLAKRHCQKTCNLCVPQAACRDGSGCDSQLQSIACNDPATSILCPVACGLCTPVKCEDAPRCSEELGSLVCNDPKFEALCPVRCGVCTRNITINTTKAPEITAIPDGGMPSTVPTTIKPKPTTGTVGTPGPINPTFAMTAAHLTPNTTITATGQGSKIAYTSITTVNKDKTSLITTKGLGTTTSPSLSVTNGSNKTSIRVTVGTDDPNSQDASTSTVSTTSKPDISTTMIEQITKVIVTTDLSTKDGQFTPMTTSTTDGMNNSAITLPKSSSVTTVQTNKPDSTTFTKTAAPDPSSSLTLVGFTSTQKQNTDTISTGKTTAARTKTTEITTGVTPNAITAVGKTTDKPTAVAKTTIPMRTIPPTTNTPTTVLQTTLPPTTVSKTSVPTRTVQPIMNISTTVLKTTHPPTTKTPTTVLKTTHPPTTNTPTTVLKTTHTPTTNTPTTVLKTTHTPTTNTPTTVLKTTHTPTTNTPTTVLKTTHTPTTNTPTTVLKTTHTPTTNTPTTVLKTTHPSTTNTPTTIPPTTPRPTTFPPTTAASTTRAGGGGHTISPDPTQCAVCVGPPELCDQLYEIQTCDPPNNYCINHVKNYEDGSRDIVRTCGNHRTCYREWFQGSSDSDKCQNFVEDNIITLSFECTYCCIKNECNIKLYPDIDTLYKDV